MKVDGQDSGAVNLIEKPSVLFDGFYFLVCFQSIQVFINLTNMQAQDFFQIGQRAWTAGDGFQYCGFDIPAVGNKLLALWRLCNNFRIGQVPVLENVFKLFGGGCASGGHRSGSVQSVQLNPVRRYSFNCQP